jgi:hypothetical protein
MNTYTKNVGTQSAKIETKVEKSEVQKEGNLPERKFRAGAISATIWMNKSQKINGEESEYKTISIERCYTDKDGKWQSTNSMRVADLPKVMVVIQKAYEALVLNEQDLFRAN